MADVNKEVLVVCVDFSKYTDSDGKNIMYDEFKRFNKGSAKVKDFLLFDDENSTVWIMCYKGSLV